MNAQRVIERLTKLSLTQHVPNCYIAPVYMALGKDEKTFELLEEGLEQREQAIHVLTRFFISMFRAQDDPRFQSLMERSWVTKL